MFPRFRFPFVLALALALALTFPVFAGGWAVITVDELPTEVVAGEPITIGFMVLQHGKTPMNDLDPMLNVHLDKTNAFVVHAKPDDKPGHYTATLTFPREGAWSWSIQAFTMDQPMPVLNVVAGAIPASPANEPVAVAEPVTSSLSALWIVRGLAVGIGVIGLVVALRRNNRKALALTGLCLVVGLGSFVTGSAVPEAEAQSKPPVVVKSDASISQVELGEQLFVAKGCITCHVNRKVSNNSEYWTIDMGAPDLSMYANDPGYLEKWLFKPSALKPAAKMPDLQLSESERAALIAFINSK